jgi:hypothetical protein
LSAEQLEALDRLVRQDQAKAKNRENWAMVRRNATGAIVVGLVLNPPTAVWEWIKQCWPWLHHF